MQMRESARPGRRPTLAERQERVHAQKERERDAGVICSRGAQFENRESQKTGRASARFSSSKGKKKEGSRGESQRD